MEFDNLTISQCDNVILQVTSQNKTYEIFNKNEEK
jgi:hypothetical protein